MQFLFDKCDEESLRSGKSPFSTSRRSLLVHNILNNLDFKWKIEKEKTLLEIQAEKVLDFEAMSSMNKKSVNGRKQKDENYIEGLLKNKLEDIKC